jgi:HlyD family secretion protein
MSATVDVRTAERNEAVTVPFSSVVMRSYDLDSLERARAAESANPTDAVQAAENPEDSAAVSDEKPEDLKGVFVIRDGKARFVQIETGIADQKHIEVTEGLTPGDSVISGPYRILRTIRDGDVVEIMRKPEKGMV